MTTRLGVLCLSLLVVVAPPAAADPASSPLRLPAIVSDGMVLQRDKPVAVWGWDSPGALVTVTFAGRTTTATTGTDGRWMTQLGPLPMSSEPRDLLVSSSLGGSTRVRDVLVGEVWLCAGQSNMAMTVDGKTGWLHIGGVLDAKRVVAESANPRVREFHVDWKVSTAPLDDCTGKWSTAGPDTTAQFSATGYFFARALERSLGVPVAIVNASWGGSTVENWTSREAITAGMEPTFVARMDTILHDYDHHDAILAKYEADLATWEREWRRDDPGGSEEDARHASSDADRGGWKRVRLPASLVMLDAPHGGVVWLWREIHVPEKYGRNWRLDFPATNAACTLFVDGVRAYEGDGRAARPTLPKDWVRRGRHVLAIKMHAQSGKAGITRGPLAIVPFDPKLPPIPLMDEWLFSVEKAFDPLPQGAPACPVAPVKSVLHWQPVPGQYNGMLHPLIPYGLRGIAWYQGESNVGSPAYGRHLMLLVSDWRSRFGQGDLPFLVCQLPGFGPPSLVAGDSEWAMLREAQMSLLDRPKVWTEPDVTKPLGRPNPTSVVQGFAICGPDRVWHWAAARIDGTRVTVTSPEVEQPVAVRYAWADHPVCNLVNGAGLPAFPFRTDSFPAAGR
jgi:sialate O-acetylesterase